MKEVLELEKVVSFLVTTCVYFIVISIYAVISFLICNVFLGFGFSTMENYFLAMVFNMLLIIKTDVEAIYEEVE